MWAQIRLLNRYNSRILFKRDGFVVPFNNLCDFCNLEAENLIHMLALCPPYNSIRYKYSEIFLANSEDPTNAWITRLNTNDPSLIKTYVHIIIDMLEVRTEKQTPCKFSKSRFVCCVQFISGPQVCACVRVSISSLSIIKKTVFVFKYVKGKKKYSFACSLDEL